MPESAPTIGVLSPLLGGEYFGTLLSGIQSAATDAGGRVIAIQTLDARLGDDNPDDSDFQGAVGWDHIDGFVVIINAVSPAYLQSISAAGKPVVMISHEVPGFDCPIVVPDNRGGIREAVTHLVEHGHRLIAFAGNRRQQDIAERYDSYRNTLSEHGIEPDESLVYDTGDNLEAGGRRAGEAMLAAGLPSTAVVVATDYSALGVLAVLSAAGLDLPRDQAIVGFDNTRSGAHAVPALSSVSQHFAFAGGTAAGLVLDALAGRPGASGRHVTGASFVARESCGCGRTVSVRSMLGTGVEGAVQRLVNRLVAPFAEAGQRTDASAAAGVGAAGERIASVFIGAAASDVPRTPGVLSAAVEDIVSLSPSRESVIGIIGSVQELNRALLAGDDVGDRVVTRLDSCLLELTLAVVEAQLHNEYSSNRQLRDSLNNEYDISLALLRRDETHPRALGWLAGTATRAACVAVWDEPAPSGGAPTMTIAGFYDSERGAVADWTGRECSPGAFPPAQILDAADGADVVFVLPIKTPSRDWGFFAAVGPIATSTSAGRETYFQWAALLSVALDHEAVVESLSRQRENLAAAYDRERGLVESIKVSEERYALAARAANDGLWDWDLTSGEIFYSSRWKAMLGYDEDSIGSRTDDWFDRVHPDDLPGLLESMHARIDGETESFGFEHRVRALDGGYRWMLCRALAVPGGGQPTTRMVGSLTDITDRKELEDRLRQGALYDGLTGLPNRTLFLDRLDRAIAHSKRRREYQFVVLFLDLDGFKVVNDSLGHTAGDRLLVQVADRIRAQLRDSDTAARFGGDEFAILLNDVTDLTAVPAIVDRIQAALAVPHELDGHEVVVSASVGLAASTTGYLRPEDVIRDSDIAMYRAKTHERGSYATFDTSMHERAVERMRVESELRHGLENREFELHYQPIVE
ncbi:MAG: diguanylate cyclase, partial [Mycobacteriales bacterium]